MNFDFGDIFSNTTFWIILGCSAVVIYAAYLVFKKYIWRKEKTRDVKVKTKTIDQMEVNSKIPAVVLDNITGKYREVDIERSIIDELAKKDPVHVLNYNNKSVVYLNYYFDETECINKYRTVSSVEKATPIFVTPPELFQDQNQTEVGIAVRKLAEFDKKGIIDQIFPYMPYLVALAVIALLWGMA